MPDLSPLSVPRPAPLPRRAMPAATILLVEDSRTAAEALRLIAQRAGLRMRRVETLAAARLHLRLYRADGVLVDLGLPDGSGLELIAELARSRHRPNHLAAISGDGDLRDAALAAGADCFVHKPFSAHAGLARLFGQGVPMLAPPLAPLAGDPLALSDDLDRAAAMLARGHLQAASRFLLGVARCAGDGGLHQAARAALDRGPAGAEALGAILEQRRSQRPLI